MLKSIFGICSAAAVIGAVLSPAAASAAVTAGAPASNGPTSNAPTSNAPTSNAPTGDPDTTVTFAVGSGLLTMTAPPAVDLGAGLPGTTLTGVMGATTVTDDRALLAASWTATASETDFTTGGVTTPETIPASAAGYDPGTITVVSGTLTPTAHTITLTNGAQPVVDATGVGDSVTRWDATLTLLIPPFAVTGSYTGTLAQSVS
jgi:hypothetical protein